jgi:hypothetical protein
MTMKTHARIVLALGLVLGTASSVLADDYLLLRSGSANQAQYQPLVEGRNVAVRHGQTQSTTEKDRFDRASALYGH